MLSLRAFTPDDAEQWDAFCGLADQATFLHSRRFLSYHGERFQDRSVVLEEDGSWVGVLPAAQHPVDTKFVVSHPGITFGGLLHAGALRGERMRLALGEVASYYAAMGYARFVYKAVPTFYQKRPAQDDLYALFRLGGVRSRCDLSSAIDLAQRATVSERRRRSLKKAQKAGVTIAAGSEQAPALWDVLRDNLERKHGVAPVHSLAEMELLMQRFPQDIQCVSARLDGDVVAGVVLFRTAMADHAQYIASSAIGYDVSALDAVFEHCITEAARQGKRWFDFGISTEACGTRLNEGLYGFKTEFGGGGWVHECFELQLET